MDKRKIKLSFVNKGKEFVIPDMTVEAQEGFLEEMAKFEGKPEWKKYSEVRKIRTINKLMVWSSLQMIDKKVSYKNIQKMHPFDFEIIIEEIGKVASSGREIKDDEKEDFQEET